MATILYDYQQSALNRICQLKAQGQQRVTLSLPCGTGKTIIASHLIRKMMGKAIIFVPTIELLSQTITRVRLDNPTVPIMAVCSDTTLSSESAPTEVTEAKVVELPVTTDPKELVDHLTTHSSCLVVSTYASAEVVADATAQAHIMWDVMVCDEAHRTAGLAHRLWALPVNNGAIPAIFRLFMTATTRVIPPPHVSEDWPDADNIPIISMDSLEDYGPHVPIITLREAINKGILSDYEVAIIAVPDKDVMELLESNNTTYAALDAQAAATQLALLHAHDTHPQLQAILAFHNRIIDSKQWCRQFRALAKVDGRAADIEVFHVDGYTAGPYRKRALNALRNPETQVVVSNCRLFSEGVDVPALDAVLFAAPRTSTPDIVQIVGRALRKHPGCENSKAMIILPVVHSDKSTTDEASVISHTTHAAAWQVIMSLADVDEQVYNNVVQLQMNAVNEQAKNLTLTTVRVDTSMLAEGISLPFTLRLLSKTTGHHPQTIAVLQSWATEHGHANPPSKTIWKNYPLGARITQVRRAYHQGTLDRKIAALYEQVRGFEWNPPKRTMLKDDSWIDLMEQYIKATNVGIIEEYSQAFDPSTGQKVAIGKKLHNYRWIKKLTAQQRQRLIDLGINNVPALRNIKNNFSPDANQAENDL